MTPLVVVDKFEVGLSVAAFDPFAVDFGEVFVAFVPVEVVAPVVVIGSVTVVVALVVIVLPAVVIGSVVVVDVPVVAVASDRFRKHPITSVLIQS